MQPEFRKQTPRQPRHRAAPMPSQCVPRKAPRRRFAIIRTILMLLGAGVVLVALARYVVVPVLVLLPQWMGGA